jgi:glycerophosphoryl diester phosphodiesterase
MWPYPRVIAHRGGGTLAPENTLAAMRCGLKYGFRAVEFDVMLSKDLVPVLLHDPTLGRTVKGRGKVPDFMAEELAALDAGTWFSADFADERVPTYEQVFRFCAANNIWMNVEIKPAPGFEEITGRVVAESTRQLLAGERCNDDRGRQVLFSSFSFDALAAAKAAAPEVPRGFLMDAVASDWRSRLEELGAVALHANHKKLSEKVVRAVKDAGFGLFCYTVNMPAQAREILSWGVDAFCTDRIDLIGPDFVV